MISYLADFIGAVTEVYNFTISQVGQTSNLSPLADRTKCCPFTETGSSLMALRLRPSKTSVACSLGEA